MFYCTKKTKHAKYPKRDCILRISSKKSKPATELIVIKQKHLKLLIVHGHGNTAARLKSANEIRRTEIWCFHWFTFFSPFAIH